MPLFNLESPEEDDIEYCRFFTSDDDGFPYCNKTCSNLTDERVRNHCEGDYRNCPWFRDE